MYLSVFVPKISKMIGLCSKILGLWRKEDYGKANYSDSGLHGNIF